MNYSSKIKKMLDSGVITKEHAQKLSKTLEIDKNELVQEKVFNRRKTMYDYTLYGLFSLVMVVFLFFLPEQSNVVIDVSKNLNNPDTLGSVSSTSTLFFTQLLFTAMAFSVFYFTSIFSYNKLVRLEQDILMIKVDIKSMIVYTDELKLILINLLDSYKEHEYKIISLISENKTETLFSSYPDLKSNLHVEILIKEFTTMLSLQKQAKEYLSELISEFEKTKKSFPTSLGTKLKKFETYKGDENE